MTAPQIIALCGPAGVGKTTLAAALQDPPWCFTRTSFAAPIKAMIATLLSFQHMSPADIERNINGDWKNLPTMHLSNKSPRHAMQTLGKEWRDLIDRSLWLNIWWEANRHLSKIVVDDARFVHEAKFVQAHGGKIILLKRPGIGPGSHLSEQEYQSIMPDGVLVNNGTIEDLLRSGEEALRLTGFSI